MKKYIIFFLFIIFSSFVFAAEIPVVGHNSSLPYVVIGTDSSKINLLVTDNVWTGTNNFTNVVYATDFCFQNGTCIGTGGVIESDPFYFLNPRNYLNQTSADSLYYSISNPNGYLNQSSADSLYYSVTNPAGYITGYTETDPNYFSNPRGYINQTSLNNITNGTWVRVTGDTMTGSLNMSDNNITDVDTLFVHNISGRSPIRILSEVISNDSITAGTFYGNIAGNSGIISGVTIDNGTITSVVIDNATIKKLNVTEWAWIENNLSVNGTIRAHNYGSMSPITFVDENGTVIGKIATSANDSNATFGYMSVHEIIVDRLTIRGLLNYSPTEPPDYYFADNVYLYKIGNNGTFTFYFNDTKLNETIGNASSGSSVWTNNSNYVYIKPNIPQAINTTKTCLNDTCDNYQIVERNDTGVYLSWY